MTGDIDAAGDLIDGTLIAQAVEPSGGGHGDSIYTGPCLNCGTRLIGSHCHSCGQSGHVHRTVGAIGHEIAHGVFHFEGKVWRTLPMLVLHPGRLTRRYVEGKVWRTLPMLVLHPGRLTRRYVDGERVRFVSPLALFLFTVFLLFAAISWVGGDVSHALDGATNPAAQSKFAQQLGAARAQLAKTEAARVAALAQHRPTAAFDDRLMALRGGIAALEAAQSGIWGEHGAPVTVTRIRTGWTRLDDGVDRVQQNPGLALYKLQSSAYKYSWVMVPLSTPFVALLFLWRRRFGLYDHAVFVTYSLCFMTLLVAAATVIGAIGMGGGWLALAVLLIPPAHMFAQLRGAYGLGKRAALWRTLVLLGFAFAALIGYAALLLLHGLAE